MRSPFKFLDAYTRQDAEIFFGREEESDTLYDLVNRNRLVLIYGSSGTGKTSLIQCGLTNRFDDTDWLPLFIRRGSNLNTALQNALRAQQEEADPEESLPEILEDLFDTYLRPLYLIFDQFEEIFILGSAEEQQTFIQNIQQIHQAGLPCHLLFILREEYLAHLYPFEKVIPSLFDRRLRVEAMRMDKAKEVIKSSCARFQVTLENPEANAQSILDKVTAGRSGVSLPYLQVYLDQLYREDYQRTYGSQGQASSGTYPPLTFSSEEIAQFAQLEDVLKVFLREQSESIQKKLQQQYPRLPGNAVRKVLGAFATLEGTKIPRARDGLSIAPLDEQQLGFVLKAAEQARVLREEEGIYEVAHDILASQIQEQRDQAEVALLEATDLVRNRYRTFQKTSTFLDRKELQLIANYEAQLRAEEKLAAEEWDFIRQSKIQQRRRRLTRDLAITGIVVLILAAVGAVAYQRAQNAEREKNLIEDNLKQVQAEKDRVQQALDRFQRAEQARKQAEVAKWVNAAQSYRLNGEPELVRYALEKALAIDSSRADLQDRLDSLSTNPRP